MFFGGNEQEALPFQLLGGDSEKVAGGYQGILNGRTVRFISKEDGTLADSGRRLRLLENEKNDFYRKRAAREI